MLRSAFKGSFPAKVGGFRTFSTAPAKIYQFEDIQKLVTKPDPHKVLVDVREPSEVKEFALPTAINLPLKTAPGALSLDNEEFQKVFHIPKPSTDKELIFFCAAGIRAQAAEELARSYGYEKTGVWPGSINEWLQKTQPKK
ncbi:Rdl2 [Kluyveromyces lactis]|nr:Rdl2 [Kluyveromyces lactis]